MGHSWAGCLIRRRIGDPGRVRLVLPMHRSVALCLTLKGRGEAAGGVDGGLVSRDDGMCQSWQRGLLVGGEVSVAFSLSGLPRGRGVRGVGDGGDAMRQGS